MKQKDKARNTFASLIRKYPNDKHSEKAKRYLQSLEGR